jgi:hypothetical protein
MPWKTLCGFPPTRDKVTLRIPNGAWRPDTVITDKDGNEIYVLLDQTNEMRSYEAIFGDLEGRRLCCIKRHIRKAFWKDGFYFCTYKPNYVGQIPLKDRDVDNKKVFPFSYLEIIPMKGRFFYRLFDNKDNLDPPRMVAENPWLGFMNVCCTPMIRCGKWTANFDKTHGRRQRHQPTLFVDQWQNTATVGPNQDLLAGLCVAYVFDRVQCQPMITGFGLEDEDDAADETKGQQANIRDDASIESSPDMETHQGNTQMENLPPEYSMSQKQVRDSLKQGNHSTPEPTDLFDEPISIEPTKNAKTGKRRGMHQADEQDFFVESSRTNEIV